jgi:Arrestin (or S-antigen), N-terminal domain
MDNYKGVTTALEGRLFLRPGKPTKCENRPEEFFQSRTEIRPTVNSWLSGRAMSGYSAEKEESVKSHGQSPKISTAFPRPSWKRGEPKRLPKQNITEPPQGFSPNNRFVVTITLAEPNLYVEGFNFDHCEAHRSAVLRGTVHLKVLQRTVLRDLKLDFEGLSETRWPESWRLRHLKKNYREVFTTYPWRFINPENLASYSQAFDAGAYEYHFELPLDSALPETIELPLGSVRYSLKATVTQTGQALQSATCSMPVNILRIPCGCSLELVEPCGATGLQHGLQYSLMLHAQSFPVGGQVPLSMKLIPVADCSWERISISIEEHIKYRTRDGLAQREQSQSKASLLDRRARQDDLARRAFKTISAAGDSMSSFYAGAADIKNPRQGSHGSSDSSDVGKLQEKFMLQLPTCSQLHPDTSYSCLLVQHCLVVSQPIQ